MFMQASDLGIRRDAALRRLRVGRDLGAGCTCSLGKFFGKCCKDGIDRDAERLCDLLHVFVSEGRANLVGADRKIALVLIDPGATSFPSPASCSLARIVCNPSVPRTLFRSPGSAACSAWPTTLPTAPLSASSNSYFVLSSVCGHGWSDPLPCIGARPSALI